MTGKENQLKKENQQLRNEIEDLKKQLDKLKTLITQCLKGSLSRRFKHCG